MVPVSVELLAPLLAQIELDRLRVADAAARTGRLYDALERIVLSHEPHQQNPEMTICTRCTADKTAVVTRFVSWPCDVLRSIEAALAEPEVSHGE